MADFSSRRGASNLGIPLMLLTFLLLGGFIYWLYVTAEPTEPVVVEEMEEEPEVMASGVAEVDPQALKTGADSFTGSQVRLEDVVVSQMIGEEAFFVDLPANDTLPAQPFLVRMAPESSGTGVSASAGDRLTVEGGVLAMSDSTIADWVTNGVISENEQILVEFSTHFIEASLVNMAGGSGGAPEGS